MTCQSVSSTAFFILSRPSKSPLWRVHDLLDFTGVKNRVAFRPYDLNAGEGAAAQVAPKSMNVQTFKPRNCMLPTLIPGKRVQVGFARCRELESKLISSATSSRVIIDPEGGYVGGSNLACAAGNLQRRHGLRRMARPPLAWFLLNINAPLQPAASKVHSLIGHAIFKA